ncbi:MAG: hypothetical protein AAB427_10345, partial [Chloroflexota bacterium]
FAIHSSALAAPPGQTNLLANGSLDSFDGSGLAHSWSRWWEDTPNPNDGTFNYAYKPDWGPETNPALMQSGGSQHVGLSWNPWHAGIRQTITVPPGARLRVTAYGRTFASTPDFPNPSDTSVASRMQIGVDPAGGAEWWSGNVQWSGAASPHDAWVPFSLDVTAGASGSVTIYLSANYKGASRYHLDVWWDNVSAVVIDSAPAPTATNPPALTAQPAAPAQPTATPLAVVSQPGATPAPSTAEPTGVQLNAPTAQPISTTGMVCVTFYEDANGNGARDGGEGLISGGEIRIIESRLSYLTDGVSEPHCFGSVPVGAQTVAVKLPSGYLPTTGNIIKLNVEPGAQLSADFGARSSGVSQPSAAAEVGDDFLPMAVFIGIVVTALLVIAGVFVFLALRRAG